MLDEGYEMCYLVAYYEVSKYSKINCQINLISLGQEYVPALMFSNGYVYVISIGLD